MAQYRGTLTGQRGQASRLGTKSSGLSAHIASWSGAVDVDLWYDASTDTDMARITLTQHHGAGQYPARVLYDGPVAGCDTWIRQPKSNTWQPVLATSQGGE